VTVFYFKRFGSTSPLAWCVHAATYISHFFKFIFNQFNYACFSPQNGFTFSIIYNHLIIVQNYRCLPPFFIIFEEEGYLVGLISFNLTCNCSVGNVCWTESKQHQQRHHLIFYLKKTWNIKIPPWKNERKPLYSNLCLTMQNSYIFVEKPKLLSNQREVYHMGANIR
jgi:hypothetical protein